MEPFIWYVRPGGKAKDVHGNVIEISQYGVQTGKKHIEFSAYLDSPWTPGETAVSFANFGNSGQTHYTKGFKDKAKIDDYLWYLVERDFGKEAITRIFED